MRPSLYALPLVALVACTEPPPAVAPPLPTGAPALPSSAAAPTASVVALSAARYPVSAKRPVVNEHPADFSAVEALRETCPPTRSTSRPTPSPSSSKELGVEYPPVAVK